MTKAMNHAKGIGRPNRAKHGRQANWDAAMIASAVGELNIDPADFQPVPSFEPQPEEPGNPFTSAIPDPIEVDPHLELALEELAIKPGGLNAEAAAPSVPVEPPPPELPPAPEEVEPEPEPVPEPVEPEPVMAVTVMRRPVDVEEPPAKRLTVEITGELSGPNILLLMQEVEGSLQMLRQLGHLKCKVTPVGGIEL